MHTEALNERIKNISIPERMRKLPVSDRGFPIPKFVPYVDDKPEFRAMDGRHLTECVKRKLCWLCAEPLGVHMTFVLGPMCAINRNNAEPPCHYRCAEYAAKACPFLTQPKMRRNEKDLPWKDQESQTAGIAIRRNPGVALLWTTRSYQIDHDRNGLLFKPGEPEHIEAFCEGRAATLDEVLHSVETGLPILLEHAERDGGDAVAACLRMGADAIKLLRAHLEKADKTA
jgi:hypothetical protein